MGAATDVTEVMEKGQDEQREPAKLEREVEDIRDNISDIVSELDRRGHEILDWRGHLRKHAWLLVAVGASCLGRARTFEFAALRRIRHEDHKACHGALGGTLGDVRRFDETRAAVAIRDLRFIRDRRSRQRQFNLRPDRFVGLLSEHPDMCFPISSSRECPNQRSYAPFRNR